jgi:nitrite reductase (NO-forming)
MIYLTTKNRVQETNRIRVKKPALGLSGLLVGLLFFSSCQKDVFEKTYGIEYAVLTDAPEVPPPIRRRHAAKVVVNLSIEERVVALDENLLYRAWTGGGKLPGKMIRVREGDSVEVHLQSLSSNQWENNVEIGGLMGREGGAGVSVVSPGQTSVFTFKAVTPGLFFYRCTSKPLGDQVDQVHQVANDLSGLLLVDPKKPLPKVDREFCIVQNEFYFKSLEGTHALGFDQEKVLQGKPDLVVFNARVSSLCGSNTLKVNLGEKVRFYFGNAGPARGSSFRLVGSVFDHVYGAKASPVVPTCADVLWVPPGATAMFDFRCEVPGQVAFMDNALWATNSKGALGLLQVRGFASERSLAYLRHGKATPLKPELPLLEKIKAGEKIYYTYCLECHNTSGLGLRSDIPPLTGSDFLTNYPASARAILYGLHGPITVNGVTYRGEMTGRYFDDHDLANLLTLLTSRWGNQLHEFTAKEVEPMRERTNY